MISPHLPVLQVVLPLISAPICLILRKGTAAWAIAVVMTWSALAGAFMLLAEVLANGPISYALGGWPAPIGIEYRIDLLGAFVLVTVSAIGAIVIVFARASVDLSVSVMLAAYLSARSLNDRRRAIPKCRPARIADSVSLAQRFASVSRVKVAVSGACPFILICTL